MSAKSGAKHDDRRGERLRTSVQQLAASGRARTGSGRDQIRQTPSRRWASRGDRRGVADCPHEVASRGAYVSWTTNNEGCPKRSVRTSSSLAVRPSAGGTAGLGSAVPHMQMPDASVVPSAAVWPRSSSGQQAVLADACLTWREEPAWLQHPQRSPLCDTEQHPHPEQVAVLATCSPHSSCT